MSTCGLLQQPYCSNLSFQPTIQTAYINSGKSLTCGLLQQPYCSNLSFQPTIQTAYINSGKSLSSVSNANRIGRTRALTELQENGVPSNPTVAGQVPNQYMVTVHDRHRGITHKFKVPEDQYILQTAENQDVSLPFACRHGCCTTCAVRVKSGVLHQPEALGISSELKSKGYALLCVGFPASDLEVETQDEDEVYWLQFGRYFARGPVERDDYALELAMGDE